VPWQTHRPLPNHFGKQNTVFKRFRDWVKRDVFYGMLNALSEGPDLKNPIIDGTVAKVHRHGQGAKEGLKAKP
jgi:transposase